MNTITIKGRRYTVEKNPVDEKNADIESGYVLTSPRGIRYHMWRNDHRRDLLFAVPDDFIKHPDPNIWITEEELAQLTK